MKYSVILILATFLSLNSYSQVYGKIIHDSITSKIYNGNRDFFVFLPNDYETDSLRNYVVGYVFDSQFPPYFTMVSSIMSYYEQTNEGESMILIGIVSENRQEEFIPFGDSEIMDKLEGPERLTKFLQEEIFPFVETRYRTKQYKVGIGHSLGGSYLIDNLFSNNSIFNAVIAASPNLVLNDSQINNRAASFLKENSNFNDFLYVGGGNLGNTEIIFKKGIDELDSIIKSNNLKKITWNRIMLNDRNHMETFVPTFDSGYLLLSSKFHLSYYEINFLANEVGVDFLSRLKDEYLKIERFTNGSTKLDVNELLKIQNHLSRSGRHDIALNICNYANDLNEKSDLDTSKKSALKKVIINAKNYHETYVICNKSEELAKEKKYKEAAENYKKAFALNSIRGTHMVRLRSIPILAQAGEKELAFKQLELLSNRYKLGGNKSLIDDPLCKPLHKDLRWQKYMDILSENANLYR